MAGLGLGETAEVPPGMAGRSRSKKAASRRGRWGRRFWLLLSLLTKVTRPSGAEQKLRLTGAREHLEATPPLDPLPQGEGKNSNAPTPTLQPRGQAPALPRFAEEGKHQKHPSPQPSPPRGEGEKRGMD